MFVKVSIDIEVQCDLCGAMSYELEIYKTEDFLYLCSDCLDKLREVPENMKEGLKNYMMGNVI